MAKIVINPNVANDIVLMSRMVMMIANNIDSMTKDEAESWDDVIRGAYRMARYFAYTEEEVNGLNTAMLRWNSRSLTEEWND